MSFLDSLAGLLPMGGPIAKVMKIVATLRDSAAKFPAYFSKIDFTDREGKGRLAPTIDGQAATYEMLPSVQANVSGVPLVFSVVLTQNGVRYALEGGHTPKGMNKAGRYCKVNSTNYPHPAGNCAFSLEPSRKAVSRFALKLEWTDSGTTHTALMPGYLWHDSIS